MKKLLILILLFIFAVIQTKAKDIDDIFNISADYLENISIIQFIEDQCDLRAQDDNFNSSKLHQCYYDSIASYQKEADKHLKSLKKELPKDSYNQLIEAQKAWEKYSKTYDGLLYATIKSTKKSDYGSPDILNRVRKHKSMAENILYLDYLMKQKGVKND